MAKLKFSKNPKKVKIPAGAKALTISVVSVGKIQETVLWRNTR